MFSSSVPFNVSPTRLKFHEDLDYSMVERLLKKAFRELVLKYSSQVFAGHLMKNSRKRTTYLRVAKAAEVSRCYCPGMGIEGWQGEERCQGLGPGLSHPPCALFLVH